jgi:hypothetical protein
MLIPSNGVMYALFSYWLCLTSLLISTLGAATRGACESLLGFACGVSTNRYLPQNKEGCGSDTSHEENSHFRGSSPIASINS